MGSGPEVISSEAHRAQFRPKGMPESFGIAFVAALRHDFCEVDYFGTELDKSEVARFLQDGPGTKEEIAKWWNDASASHVCCLWDKELISQGWTAETVCKDMESKEQVEAEAPEGMELFIFWLSKIALDFRVELEYIAEARHSLLEKGMFTKDDEFEVTADFECLRNFSRFDFPPQGSPCAVSKGAKGRVIKHDVLGSGYIAANLEGNIAATFSPRQQSKYLKLLSGAGEGNSHPAGPMKYSDGGCEPYHNDVTEWLKVRSGLAKDRCARFPSALETLWMLDSPVKQLESYAQGLLSELQSGGQNA